ncbi:MAG: Antitoxin VapB41 [Verrucomicrobiales bacterium]|nr:Antitoxin VapB41 [Verrucomicrobiales bacterium]
MKLRAVTQGRTVKDLVAELIRKGLGISQPQPESIAPNSMVQIGERGLPIIRCGPGAPATRMSIEELLKLEERTQLEEDAKRARQPV